MRLFGFEVTRAKQMSPVGDSRGGWWPWVREPYAGAWQRNQEWTVDTVLAHHAVYACVSLIASDIGKLRPKLVEQNANGIWQETSSPSFSPVLKKPNAYQNRIQFIESWITSKLLRGNAYILKERDARGVVTRLYVLDPSRVTVLVTEAGDVFYRLQADNLAGIDPEDGGVVVPAREIIHDRMNCLFHPLVGTSPIFACGMAANLGLHIEKNSASFFGSGSNPSGVLTSPESIPPDKAAEMREQWKARYGPGGPGGIAVLGFGMKFEPMRMTATDSQLIEQLRWSAETVASAFHVPAFKIGVGQMPTYQNGELLDQRYYSDCLQSHIESLELCVDEGLGLDQAKGGKTMGVELDLDGLLRMDSKTQMEVLVAASGGPVLTPNDARNRVDLPPLEGGDTLYRQQQDFSLAALAERDRNKPFAKPDTPQPPAPAATPVDEGAEERAAVLYWKAAALEQTRAA